MPSRIDSNGGRLSVLHGLGAAILGAESRGPSFVVGLVITGLGALIIRRFCEKNDIPASTNDMVRLIMVISPENRAVDGVEIF